ncbi:MAG TPA: hypothetical protein VIJ59_08520 [Caulobacteraceae bacterium]
MYLPYVGYVTTIQIILAILAVGAGLLILRTILQQGGPRSRRTGGGAVWIVVPLIAIAGGGVVWVLVKVLQMMGQSFQT